MEIVFNQFRKASPHMRRALLIQPLFRPTARLGVVDFYKHGK